MNFSKLTDIPPSATLAMNARALEKKKQGQHVFNLTTGEPVIETDQRVIDAAHDAMKRGETRYVAVPGITELRTAMSGWINKTYNTSYSVSETMVTCGGKSALNLLAQALLEPGDEAIILAPYWVSYTAMVRLFGGNPIIVEGDEQNEWNVSAESIKQALTEKTKLLFLNNASNPTGVFYTDQELKEILQLAQDNNVLVISDEVYSGLVYDGQSYTSCGSFSEFKDNLVIVQSCSKNFAMTGWRVGFVLGPESIIKRCSTIQGQSTSGTSSISQWAAVAALEYADSIVPTIASMLEKRRDVFVDTFNQLFDFNLKKPKSALYSFIPISAFGVEESDSLAFCLDVLEKGNVAMVPGIAFGKEGYVRCSFGISEEQIVEALTALKTYFQ